MDIRSMKQNISLDKIKEILNVSLVISVFGILLYRVNTLRKLCKNVCKYIFEICLKVDISVIKKIYFKLEMVFRLVVLIWIFFTLVYFVYSIYTDYNLKKDKGDDRFSQSLLRYLHSTSAMHCFLVTGAWGAGKSFAVNSFFEKYYSNSRVNIYRISCFGLNTRKELVNEISEVVESKDNSIFSAFVKLVQFIPVIGAAISKLFNKTYGYNNAKKGSIFIFDDFERMSVNTLFDDNTKGRDDSTYEKSDYEKYIAITGLINELVEVYEMKVIIICNSNFIGHKFVDDVLRDKLNCLEYKFNVSSDIKKLVIKNICSNTIFDDIDKQKMLVKFFNLLVEVIDKNKIFKFYDNLRFFRSVLDAFVTSVALFDSETLSIEFMNSLFNSIMLCHICYYNSNMYFLKYFKTGGDINFYFRFFHTGDGNLPLIHLNNNENETKWISSEISGYWIANLNEPNIESIIEEWNNYKYCDLENKMIKDGNAIKDAQGYSLIHLLYYFKFKNNNKYDDSLHIDEAFKDINLSIVKNVEYVLDIIPYCSDLLSDTIFKKDIFEKLKKGNAVGDISNKTTLYKEYKEYLDKNN